MSVTVILLDNKRLTVKANVNTLFAEILEKVCDHSKFDSNLFTLSHKNKHVDLGNSLRLSGISLNSELELVEAPKSMLNQKVTISVQFQDHERKTGEFTPTTTLWGVVEALFQENLEEILDSSKVLAVNFMNRQFEGREKLESTTLKSIGVLKGRVAFRLNSREKNADSEQKFVENIQFKRPEPPKEPERRPDSTSVKSQTSSGLDVAKHFENLKKEAQEKRTEKMEVDVESKRNEDNGTKSQASSSSKPVKKEEDIWARLKGGNTTGTSNQPKSRAESKKETPRDDVMKQIEEIDLSQHIKSLGGENEEIFYSLDDIPKVTETDTDEQLPESFFDHTIDDVKHLLGQLRRNQSSDSPLETEKLRKKRQDTQRERFSKTIVRVQFPSDRLVFQGIFRATDSVKDVLAVLHKYMVSSDVDMHLFPTPPKRILDSETSLFDAGIVPMGQLFGALTSGDLKSIVKPEIRQQLSTFVGAEVFAARKSKDLHRKSD